MDEKIKKYPVSEEKITDLVKKSGIYSPPEKYNVNRLSGDSNDDHSADNSSAGEGNAWTVR